MAPDSILQSCPHRLYVLHGVILLLVHDFVFVEFYEEPISLFLQHLEVPPL